MDGVREGDLDGDHDSPVDKGPRVGDKEGVLLGIVEGCGVLSDGCILGDRDGPKVGKFEGPLEGAWEGCSLGWGLVLEGA